MKKKSDCIVIILLILIVPTIMFLDSETVINQSYASDGMAWYITYIDFNTNQPEVFRIRQKLLYGTQTPGEWLLSELKKHGDVKQIAILSAIQLDSPVQAAVMLGYMKKNSAYLFLDWE